MRRFSPLPWFLLVMGSTALAAAGPGLLPRNAEIRRSPTPTPAPREASKPAAPKPAAAKPDVPKPVASKPAAVKPTVARTEPRRTAPVASASARSGTSPALAAARASAANASASQELVRSAAARELAPSRRSLREWDLWLAAIQMQHAEYAARLASGGKEVARLNADPSLAALTSGRNRQEAAIPAAEALRANGQGNWPRYLSSGAARPAPIQVEQLMKQGESIAFRTSTSTSDTQGLIARIRRTPGVAAGGHLGLEAMAPDLMTAHLRTVPGTPGDGSRRAPYAVQQVDGLRASLERGRAELAEQFGMVRREWITSSTRADELHRKYLQLRTALVAPDE